MTAIANVALTRVAPLHRPLHRDAQHAAPASPPAHHWREGLALIEHSMPFTRRVVHAGEAAYRAGDAFGSLYVINAGQFKTVNLTADGRGQVVGLHFKGDWLGFDGIDRGRHGCDAVALDTGELWTINYSALLEACATVPALMRTVHAAMSGQITREHDSLLALGTLPADARVAHFLLDWAEALAARDLRTDQINLRMTRAEIGNYLGMTLETVSRALGRLAQAGTIRFNQPGRREIAIPSLQALRELIQASGEPADTASWPAPAALAYRAC
jgi:CRP/FNR family transcriptional regulator, anaerobic regulatory protein